jgi:hypothetical protein
MIFPVICFVGGLVAMGRTKPQTAVRKLICLGPRSGVVYPVEDFREIGTVVVRAPGGRAVAQFIRASVREQGKPGLVYQHGQGDPQALEMIRRDFGVEFQPPAAVKPAAAPSKAAPRGPLSAAESKLYFETLAYRAPEALTPEQKLMRARIEWEAASTRQTVGKSTP